jgi:uncharacterized protein (TIGR03000 family)
LFQLVEVGSMYSMVLMAALTTGVDVPDLGRRGGGGGCSGCYGGGGGGGGHGRRGGGGGGCCGCYGGGYGGGCMGMGMGGGCMGMGMGGGCMGMGMGGGCMGMGMGGGCMGMGGGVIMQGGVQQGTGKGEKIQKKPATKGEGEGMAPAPATIVVDLPADAKLLIDDAKTTSTGTSRVFVSPELNPGKAYHYTLKAEVVRNGKPVKMEKVIEVKAGGIAQVQLTLPAVSVAQR